MEFPSNPFRTHGGVKAPHRKNTCKQPAVMMPPPEQVIIPLVQHIGAPCVPLVKAKDPVLVGQKIAESPAFLSAPIHATVSGTVASITEVTLCSGQSVQAIILHSDGTMTVSPDVKPPVVNSKEEFLQAVKESGLVGLGGAGFPTHVKLNVPEGKQVDTLLINGAECEPYITTDHREMLEDGEAVLDGIFAVKQYLNIPRVIIGIEANKPDAIKYLKDLLARDSRNSDRSVGVLTLRARYPQGAEKVLVQAATKRIVPEGKLPLDVGCIVMNVTSVGFLGNYLKTGMPLISKRVTLDGSALANPQNVIVPIGTKISDVIAFCGGYKEEAKKIILGGPMMGFALFSDEHPIIKQNNGVLALNEKQSRLLKPSACIHCGFCLEVCPMHLMPSLLEKYTEVKDTDELKDLSVMTCMECGCCSFNCPAGRPLVHAIRLGKTLVRKADAAAKARAEAEAKKAAEQAKMED